MRALEEKRKIILNTLNHKSRALNIYFKLKSTHFFC